MSTWQLASDSLIGPTVLSLGVGLAVLFAVAWCVAQATRDPLWRRMIWRSTVGAAGVWVVCEVVGGHAFLSTCIDKWRSQSAVAAIATDRPEDFGAEPVAEPLVWEIGASEGPDAAFWDSAEAEYELVIEPMVPATRATSWREELLSPTDVSEADPADAIETPDPFAIAPVAAIGWLAGTLAVSVWFLGRRMLVMYFTWRHTSPAWAEVTEEVRAVVRQLESLVPSVQPHPEAGTRRPDIPGAGSRANLLRRFRSLQSDGLAAPVVYGVVRPTLAVPTDFLQSLPRAQREAVLAHELVHVAGRDPLWQAVFDAFAALAWWHPFAWLARRAHKTACEAAADEGAAALPGGSRSLAAALVRLAREVAAQPQFGWAALDRPGRGRSRLGRRVVRLLSGETVSRPFTSSRRGLAVRAISVGVLILSLLFGTAVARSGKSDSAMQFGGNPMKVWQTSWRSSFAAAALAAVVGASPAAEENGAAVFNEDEIISEIEIAADEHAAEIQRIEAELELLSLLHPDVNLQADEIERLGAEIKLLAQLHPEVELELVNEEALNAVENALELLVEVEPQVELLFTNEEEEEEADEEDEADDEEEADKDEAEADEADEDDEEDEGDAEKEDERVDRHDLANAWTRAQREIQRARAQKQLAQANQKVAKERDQISKQLLQLLEQARAEAAEGRRDSAQEIMERVRQLARVWRMQPADRPAHLAQLEIEDEMRVVGEGQMRVQHLMQAAENLKAAGKDDLAEELMREAKSIAETKPARVTLRKMQGEPIRAEVRRLHREPIKIDLGRLKVVEEEEEVEASEGTAVDQLHQEVNELKSQMNDMRTMLQRIVEQMERDSNTKWEE